MLRDLAGHSARFQLIDNVSFCSPKLLHRLEIMLILLIVMLNTVKCSICHRYDRDRESKTSVLAGRRDADVDVP